MRKNGFTIIELLAVIIILAIIALIATSITTNIIEKNRIKAAETSIASIEHAAEVYYYNNGGISETVFNCKEGICSNGKTNLELKGTGPEDGRIKIDKEGNITISSLIIDGYLCYKEDKKYICQKASKAQVNTTNGILALEDSVASVSNYLIKGNSYQATRSGKNLIKPQDIFSGYSSYKEQKFEGRNTIQYIDNETYKYTNYKFKENTQYTVSAEVKTTIRNSDNELNSMWFVFYYTDGTNSYSTINRNANWTRKTVTSTAGKTVESIGLSSYNYSNLIYIDVDTFQIEEGSTATEYEPYGVVPSPNYSSEVLGVGDLVTDKNDPNYGKYAIPIKVIGKNLLEFNIKDQTNGDVTIAVNDDKSLKIKNTGNKMQYININSKEVDLKIVKGKKYKLTLGFSDEYKQYRGKVILTIRFKDKNGAQIKNISTTDVLSRTFEIPENAVSYDMFFTIYSTSEIVAYPMVYESDLEDISYEKYNGYDANIYLDEPLRKIGDYLDYIDYRSGQVVRNIVEVDLKDLSWTKSGTSFSDSQLYLSNGANGSIHSTTLSTHFNYKSNIWSNNVIGIDGYYDGLAKIKVRTPYLTLSEFTSFINNSKVKAYLINTSGKPIIENIDLPEININKDIRNIYVDTKIKPSEFILDYYK